MQVQHLLKDVCDKLQPYAVQQVRLLSTVYPQFRSLTNPRSGEQNVARVLQVLNGRPAPFYGAT